MELPLSWFQLGIVPIRTLHRVIALTVQISIQAGRPLAHSFGLNRSISSTIDAAKALGWHPPVHAAGTAIICGRANDTIGIRHAERVVPENSEGHGRQLKSYW